MKKLIILGSTGSIGESALEVVSLHPDLYSVEGLSANKDIEKLFQQCLKFKPSSVAVADEKSAEKFSKLLKKNNLDIEVFTGRDGLNALAAMPEASIVIAAIVGSAGLEPTLEAIRCKKQILLANKEALVMAGSFFIQEIKKWGAKLLPIDSEHNAIFQCLPENYINDNDDRNVRKVYLTASGGPFRNLPYAEFDSITPEQACAHPNWDMGPKISVDSATMMNKGLEIIEARWLFDILPERIEVVIHPQSIVHSMVEFIDGSVLAQLSNPDMRVPIANALAWPDRHDSGAKPLNIFEIANLDFFKPDFNKFPCLQLAYDAINAGGSFPAILNAANEVAVQNFLSNRISFNSIPRVIENSMKIFTGEVPSDLASLIALDREVKEKAEQIAAKLVK